MADPSDAPHRLVAPAIVGRDGELRRAVDAVTAAPALVVVAGEAGIGKTRLVGELAAAAARSGRRPLLGRCHALREPFPLGPVIEAVRGLGDRLGELALSPVAGALRPFLPELAHVLPPAPDPLGDRAAERHRVFRGFVEVFAALGPSVLILEDLHWAEAQTGDFAGYLLAEALPELSVVVTYRPEAADPRVRALAAGLPSGTTLADVALTPLGPSEVGALAASIIGVDAVSEEFASYLSERTSGLPFAVEELVALLQERGTLVQRRGGGWARRALDELDVPTRIRDSVLERVARLGDPARRVVEAAAVLQVPVPLSLLVATAPLDRATALPAVGEALDSGVLAEHGDDIGFRHPLAAQAVHEDLAGPRRLLLHDRAATALAAAARAPAGQLAHHLRHADRRHEWVAAAERAAEQAFELSNDAEAVRILEDVLRHGPATPERRGRLAVLLGEAAIEAGRSQDAAGLLTAVLDEELPAPVRGELRFRLGGLLHDAGTELLRAHQLFADAVDDLDHRPDLKAWAMVVLGIPMAGDADPAEHRAWLQRALTVVPEIPDHAFQAFLLGKIAMVQVPTGDPAWRTTAERVEHQTGGEPRHRREINAYWSIGTQATYAGHHALADRLLTAGLTAAAGDDRARVETRMERSLRSGLVLLRYCQGSWDELADHAAVLMEELAGNPRARIDGEAAAACLTLARGDLDDAAAALTAAVDLVDELSGFDLLPIPAAALFRLAVARGEAGSVLGRADRLLAAAEPKGVLAPSVRALPAVAEALVAAGRSDDAERTVRRFAARLDGLDAPLAPAALAHADGFVRLGAGDPGGAATSFAAAARLYVPQRAPYEAAQARELAASTWLAAALPVRDAGSELLAALAAYRELGAEWDAGRATATARRHGLSVPARHRGGRRGYGSQLSPREREVAELAAKGRTNKEIAAELYLSVNTVARHITTSMRKLGVRSRAAIAHRLDQN
ncbi:helix-turn-helix transcriptional regulator [Jiangella alba]|uniref:Regulatory protein, luxR family n=1 Tax=Jiangella alba TaxID=561176 RepID=A0A1H5HLG5_9ACTN|nr:AAA family ATPase [Jiangella alba]SEE28852.1 regulatory protein, luxR family [Jiangella alba]